MKKILIASSTVAAFVLTAGVVLALTFAPTTGTGRISRGNIISKFGVSALTMNPSITFSDVITETLTCTKTVGRNETKVLERTRTRTRTMNSSVDYDVRLNPQDRILGYILTGFGSELNAPEPMRCPNPNSHWIATYHVVVNDWTLYFNGNVLVTKSTLSSSL